MAHAGGATPILPDEYQQVEYLQSTGEQVIDLGSQWLAATQSEFEFAITNSYTFGNASFILGGYNGQAYSIAFPTATAMRVPSGASFTNHTIPNVLSGTHNVVYSPNQITYDNANYSTASGIGNAKFWLFGRGDNFKTEGVRLYYYKRYNTNSSSYTHDLIPCYRKADNVTGMYNMIDNTFIPYTGTTNFIYG